MTVKPQLLHKIIAGAFLCIACTCGSPVTLFAVEPNVKAGSERAANVPEITPIGLFRKFISVADGDRCPMYPTCSHYASEAFAQKGVLMGWILTCDRLLRCGRDETRLAPKVRIKGTIYTFDPLTANTFWWDRP